MISKLGKYELLKTLGKGATSTVYLARDPFAEREVAIKVATPEALNDPQKGKLYSKLFLNEASLVGKLEHPHIAHIFDAVVSENFCYIVMEYVPGGTLEAHAQPNNLLTVDRVIELIFKCTRALAFAQRIGITHRDIKPANLLLTRDGEIKISDFGAAIASDQNEQTQISAIGSPAYMSPEQIQELTLDHRTDIYSLGVVMFQLLTGRLPFEARNQFNMISLIMNNEAPKPSSLRTELPPVLDTIVGKAMAKDRNIRYQTWEDFAHDLAQAVRNRQLLIPRAEFSETEKFDTLRALPFFADFSDAEIWAVLRFSRWQRVAPNTIIMRDGDIGDFFCFLTAGKLSVSKHGKLLNTLKRGDCFGEMAAINSHNHLRSANISSLTVVDIVTIPGGALLQATESCRMHFYQSFLGVLASRLALANEQLAEARSQHPPS